MEPHEQMVFTWARDSASYYHQRIVMLRSTPVRDGDLMAEQDRKSIPALVRHLDLLGESLAELHARYADDQAVTTALEAWSGFMLDVG
jgi:hypothetical protein